MQETKKLFQMSAISVISILNYVQDISIDEYVHTSSYKYKNNIIPLLSPTLMKFIDDLILH